MSPSPKQILDKALTHSTRLCDIPVSLGINALDCGFPTIEHYEYLVQGEGRITTIAARPGNGKTALACQIALNVSKWGRTLYLSLEMKKEALKTRLLGVSSGIPIRKLSHTTNKVRLDKAIEDFAAYKLDIIDTPGLTIEDLIIQVLDEARREPLNLVVIDYVGLIDFEGENRALALGKAVVRIKKEVAEHLKIPVILLAQMKRGFEDKYARAKMEYEKAKQYATGANEKILEIRPGMEDLGESSWLEHASDVIMFLHRPCLLNPDISPTLFQVFVAKNRHGESKDFVLEFSQELTRFVDHGVL